MENQASYFNLPNEAISLILLNLPLKDLLNCSLVNKLFNELTNQNFIWKNLFIKDHDGIVINHEGSWKELYKQDAPLFNLKNGRFIYSCLAKSVQMKQANGDLERLYDFQSPIAATMNLTVNYRGSYCPSSTESSSLVNLKSFKHRTIKGAAGRHVKLVGKYWLVFDMETQTAPYSSGVTFRNIKVYPYNPDSRLKIPETPEKTLDLEWEKRTYIWGEFSGTSFAHYRTKRNEDYYTYDHAYVEFYDFAENTELIHKVKLPGQLILFSENYVGSVTGKLENQFKLYNWRSKADPEKSSITITVPNNQKITGTSASHDRVAVYDESGHLNIFDGTNGTLLNQFNIEEQTKQKGAFITLVENVCTLALKKDRNTVGHAVIDIRTGQVIQMLNFGAKYGRTEPLQTNGKFSGKIFVSCEGDVGIIDLTSPFIHEKVNVLSIPGNADSIDTAELSMKFHRVSTGRLWCQLAELCECPAFHLDSHVIKEVKDQCRYVIVFNTQQGKVENATLKQFFSECTLQHDTNCPIQGVSLDPNTPALAKDDFGYVLCPEAHFKIIRP